MLWLDRNNDLFIPERKCSRFQFECKSTRECIAIYNACDGIPQCPDGSDEGPECPDNSAPTTPPPNTNPSSPLHSLPVFPAQNQHPNLGNLNQNQDNPRPPLSPIIHEHIEPKVQSKSESDFIRPGINRPGPLISNQVHYEPQPPPYPSYPQHGSGWIPHQSNQMPPQISPYIGKNFYYNIL